MIESFILDDMTVGERSRWDSREDLALMLARPDESVDPEGAAEFDREQFRLKREREFAEQAAEAQEMPEEFDPNVLIGRVQGTV